MGGAANTVPTNTDVVYQMMQQMMGQQASQGGGGGTQTGTGSGAGPRPGETQEEAAARQYRVQLEKLSVMGFPDRMANLQGESKQRC